MANCHELFSTFNDELKILSSKKDKMITSKDNLRKVIRDHFSNNHPNYTPTFYIQGSYKLGTSIRNKEDHCDLDDGVYFKSNPDNVTGTTLQNWLYDAVAGVTAATPIHKSKCIRVDYQAGYHIDLPVMVFDNSTDDHPMLAVKNDDFKTDDPKEFVDYYNEHKTQQMTRLVKYLKSWCDHKRESMPSGLSMTVLLWSTTRVTRGTTLHLSLYLLKLKRLFKTSSNVKCPLHLKIIYLPVIRKPSKITS